MLQKLKHINLLQPRVITGVEVVVDSLSDYGFRYTQIKNYYGTITIKKSTESLIDISELTQEIGKNKAIPFSPNPPLSVVFTGGQIITKEIKDYSEEDDESRLLQKTLPGARLADFYLQIYHTEEKTFVTVVKKSIIDNVLEELKAAMFYIQDVQLGPFVVLAFKTQLIKNDEIGLPSGVITFNQLEILNLSSESNTVGPNVQIGDDTVPFKSILSFATAFNYFSPNSDIVECNIDLIQKEKTEIKFGIYQVALLRLFLMLISFVALTNFFLGKQYVSAYESLQDSSSGQKNTYMLFQAKQQELIDRISLLNNTGVSSRGGLSFYADRMGQLIPESIQLLEFKIVPIQKKIKKGEKVELDPSKMIMKGIAPISLDLNEWVLRLGNEDWISETIILNYSQTDREHPGVFDLEIKLNG